MSGQRLLHGDTILDFIIQRPPMVMVDTLYSWSESSAEAGLTIKGNNVFCIDGRFIEPGIIEHSAQSAALFAGYGNFVKGKSPETGLIGEIKKYSIFRIPSAGEELHTKVSMIESIFGMSLVSVKTVSGEKILSSGQIKIFVPGYGSD
ncbi:MAG: hypothetical protein LKI42_05080 [Bacteroidales bacterium]|jgi:predicted hotdog family 3-hydroxylacyl-ACP dehydratase|nr:hypothetical protein [Bacteroidales bacterium]MCI1786285.1 hypothetical protein [Bacteroidales bacterium]